MVSPKAETKGLVIFAHSIVFWVALVTALVLLIFRQWKAAGIVGVIAAGALIAGVPLAQPPGNTETASAASPNADATPIMEVTPAPDPYADCLNDAISKRHCLKIAIAQHYRLTSSDRNLAENTPEPTATENTPEPTATPESAVVADRPQREAAQKYWNGVIGLLAIAGAGIEFAGQAVQGGDPVTAQQLLSTSEQQADLASQAALNGAPDGWDNISSSLYGAANTYKKAIGEFKDGLAQDDSEKTANALDDATSAGESITEATHDARVWYEQNGGKWSDIEDYLTAEKSVSASFKSLMNSSNQ